ncbi:tRNA (adenosine(37)-N6)-threonylcarbamoyltransferase complex dimerization subunit type 1 TsaB [Lactococcus muris]|uniref:tRNA (Adenosine(37)-N6)-threonylcarbamoyltransferase complex dimerization subunit type 1 TsaB n=1 Tax=Lactococcus muris TaxID=2941330 RepID=A0ABV4D8X6_9LACT|nr:MULTISPECIES: tRNA (adenosine(37)-N6)-threonylcarbamoyltransferase complex dimerization subunit type 1 TsaB [Lactococcus]MBL3716949.1 tRNA (adenosine(37)-N6)-threonylcarbamoyltransferase complex dimerization subunit type 1 TsaB [Lactococcus garvieae]HAP14980.1 tRNA (adenosine(37)-N6)-threonylcarbamoyltransferase complex dimerization subunit type 1 TsaB [Lactococcus sp.]
MKILAFDSSSKALSVALVDNDVLLGEITLNLKKNHSTTLMTSVDFLMQQAAVEASELDRIVVAQGPGSYTGLRLAATVGKTLAYSLNKELVGVSSLLAIAKRLKTNKAIVPVMDARRGNAYAALYKGDEEIISGQHCAFREFLEQLDKNLPVVFTGETENFVADIKAAEFANFEIIEDSLEKLPSAYQMARLGKSLEPVEVHGFAPNYLKKVEAEEKWLETHEEAESAAGEYVQRI